jgi:hypothetical protein
MPPGGVDFIPRSQFLELFGDEGSAAEMKSAASLFGEKCGCRVVFVGAAEIYVQFRRLADTNQLVSAD